MSRHEALPDAEFFPIMPWGPLRGWEPPYVTPQHGLESIAACGFTVAGFVQPADLPRCEALGLRAIVAPPRRPRYMAEEWASLSDETLDARVRETVGASAQSPAVLGYFVMDEPGAQHFPLLAKVVAAFRRHAPDQLAYINLYPNYATLGAPDESQLGTERYSTYLERFVAEVKPQVLSYDNYHVLYADDLQDSERAARYYRNLLEVRQAALAAQLPWWQVVASNQIRAVTTVPSPANLLFQAYTTLAAGGTGVSWFTYYATGYGYAPIDKDGHKTATWFSLQMANHQLRAIGPLMARLHSTGVFASVPLPCAEFPTLPGRYVQSVEAATPLMVGEFIDPAEPSGAAYVMVVNLSLERSTAFRLHMAENRRIVGHASVDDGRFHPLSDDRPTWLTAGQGALLLLG